MLGTFEVCWDGGPLVLAIPLLRGLFPRDPFGDRLRTFEEIVGFKRILAL